ncbi:MAG: hypothetical protein D6725_05730 [Planctomycetota bacterium]|nr:MAG: hypothetical protein D6725_05730 [Planctomycetota bacterium]
MSTSGTPEQNVEQRIEQLNNEIERLSKSLRRGSTATLIVGLVIIALLCGYFAFAYRLIMPRLGPAAVVATAVGFIEQQLPEASSELKRMIDDQADDWARSLSEQLLAKIPDFREQIAELAEKQMAELVASTIQYSEDEIRKVLREHKDTLNRAVEELAASERLSDRTVQELEAMLEQQLKAELEEHSAIVLETVRMLNEKIKKLKEGKNLNKEEKLERRALMLARRLQLNAADPSLKDKPVPGVVNRKPAATAPAGSASAARPPSKPAAKSATPSSKAASPAAKPSPTPGKTTPPAKNDKTATPAKKDQRKAGPADAGKGAAPKSSVPKSGGSKKSGSAATPKEPPPPPLPEDPPSTTGKRSSS